MIGRNGSSVSDFTTDMKGDLRIPSDFQQRWVEKLENHADMAGDHGAAIGYYTSALSLYPTNISDIILKCCKARANLLEEELVSATKVWILCYMVCG
jgi:hypothetical protein